ncbi:MAG: PDZ domain-containing protein [Candidatus Manganitrophus sp.]|nr:MAG: PDZ domain-containing protein [Candidatus Manganitrophus sp.]
MVDRREIENAVNNLPQLLTKARIVPNFSEGKPDGFRIFAITEDSLYAKIGLQNGDILHRVNGIEVKDPQNFLKVFEQLKDENAINVDLVRNNQRETFSYEVR